MSRPWSPERELSEPEARALIESRFPELAPVRLEVIGAGWDNTAFRVNGDLVFRFPRRTIAVECLETETRLLPAIAPLLPLAVPVPIFVGTGDESYPWPFAGYRMLAGRDACEAALLPAQRVAAAEPLARFLAALHAIPHDGLSGAGAPGDTLGRLDLSRRAPQARERLEALNRLGLTEETAPWNSIFDAVSEVRDPEATTLVHGDLYVGQLLVDDAGELCGVIDWGDVHVGDPAIDISLAHGFLPPEAHDTFRRAYGEIDDETWALARFRALYHAVTLAEYAQDVGDEDLVRESLTALTHLGSGG